MIRVLLGWRDAEESAVAVRSCLLSGTHELEPVMACMPTDLELLCPDCLSPFIAVKYCRF